MDTWRAKWTSTPAPRPAAGGGGGTTTAAVGVSLQAYVLRVDSTEKRTNYSLLVLADVRVDDSLQLKYGQQIQIAEWSTGPAALPAEAQPLDLVKVDGVHTKSSTKDPGKVGRRSAANVLEYGS